MKNLNKLTAAAILAVASFFGLLSSNVRAQEVEGALNFGFDAGLNKYWGNFSDSHFGLGGDLFIRWNIIDWVSLRASYNGGVIGYKSTGSYGIPGTAPSGSIGDEHALFPVSAGADGSPAGSLNHIRYGGWDLMGEINFFPDQTFVPFFEAGIEALNFEPDDATPSPLRGNANAAYSKNVIGGVTGVGFDMFITQKVTFNGQLLLHLTGTDWLDDYSNPNNYRQDVYLTFGLGFSYNLFTPPQPEPPPAAPASSTTIINNNYFTDTVQKAVIYIDTVVVAKVDTVFMTGTTDTIYVNPPVNTIFNFPGTLFIVNTDQFNTAVPGNLANLYQIKHLVEQCPNLRVEIQGFASAEGTPEHNQRLSELRADRIKTWLVAQGVSPDKVASTRGFGTSNPAVKERSDVSAAELERERVQNRRIAVKVVQACQ